jgi:hypothetical protein
MTRKLSLTTAVAVAALSIGAPAAFGEGRLAGSVEPVLAQPDPMIEDGFAQAVAAKRALESNVGTYRDAHERGVSAEPQWMTALRIRSEALNKQYGLGEFATNSTVSNYRDAFERAVPPATASVPVSVTSGTDIEWPQVGVGLGIGLLLALGLGLIMRAVHIRPFAH